MSEHDFSGIDERDGRWWGLTGGTLLLIGSLIVLVAFGVIVTALGLSLGD